MAAAVLLGVALVVFVDDGDEARDRPGPLPEPVETADGWTVEAVGWTPGATALATATTPEGVVVRATDTQLGRVVEVADPAAAEPVIGEAVPFDSLPRLDRAWPAADGEGYWVAEADELLHVDDQGDSIEDPIELEQPAAIAAVTPAAVWLTVSGLPIPDHSGVIAPRSAVQRVDLATREVVLLPVDDPVTFRFEVGDGAAWATVGETVQKLDLVTMEPVATVELSAPARDLVLDGDDVVVVVTDDAEVAQVVRIDAGDATITETIELDPGEVSEATVVGSADGEQLWVLRPELDRVDRVTADGRLAEPIDLVEPRRIEVLDGDVWLLGGLEEGVLLRARRER